MEQKTKDTLENEILTALAVVLIGASAFGFGDSELLEDILLTSDNLTPLDKTEAIEELKSIAGTLPPESLKEYGITFTETPVAPQSMLEAYELGDGKTMLVDKNILVANAEKLIEAANEVRNNSSNIATGYGGALAAGMRGYRELRHTPEPTFVERVRADGKKAENWQHFNEQQANAQSGLIDRN